MLDIGTELARMSGDGPPAIRIVGLESQNSYVCQELPFGQNASYSPEELRLLYGATNPEIVIVSEQESWKLLSTTRLKKANRDAIKRVAAEDLPSPEQHFAKVAAEAAKAKS